jgi:predicted GNAT superfamily acetyltransferase
MEEITTVGVDLAKSVFQVHSDPPNPASDAFATLGFRQVGSATIDGGSKTVRYLSRALRPRSPERSP